MPLQTINNVDGLVFILGMDVADTNTNRLNRVGYTITQYGLTYYYFAQYATPQHHLISQYGLIHYIKSKYSTSQRTITQQFIFQQLITPYTTSQYMITHYHTSESILSAYATTEHYTTEHYRTEHYNTEHYTTERYRTEHYTTQHYTTEHYTTEQYTTNHYTTEHYTSDHYTTEHYEAEQYPTEPNPTPDHRETPDLRITCSPENILKGKENRQKRTSGNRRRKRRFTPYEYRPRGHKATTINKTYVKPSTPGNAVCQKIKKCKWTVDKRTAPQRRKSNRFAPYVRKV